jgi:hypothetical protein
MCCVMMSKSSNVWRAFDAYCREHRVADEDVPVAFAAFLSRTTGWDGEMHHIPTDG